MKKKMLMLCGLLAHSVFAGEVADVLSVKATGEATHYQFAVTIKSPDTGCEQYANWWEVLSADGKLIYRRILTHSHVAEQPFMRSGGAVNIAEDEKVYIRAHMFPTGFGGQVLVGSVKDGFKLADDKAMAFVDSFDIDVPKTNCAF